MPLLKGPLRSQVASLVSSLEGVGVSASEGQTGVWMAECICLQCCCCWALGRCGKDTKPEAGERAVPHPLELPTPQLLLRRVLGCFFV